MSSGPGKASGPQATDSAGVPWLGRAFQENRFATDDGSPPAELAAAMGEFRAGRVGLEKVVASFSSARLLVPVVALAGEVTEAAGGMRTDKTQELALVTVAAPDGRAALPVFSSLEALSRWGTPARPVPVDGQRVALAAAADSTPLVVIDPGAGEEIILRAPALRAIAMGAAWLPPECDPYIAAALTNVAGIDERIRCARARSGDPQARLSGPDLEVHLALAPGLDAQAVHGLISRLSETWRNDSDFASRIDALGLRIEPAER